MTEGFKNTLVWLLAGTVGVFIAMNWASASFTGAEYLPAGNDSFYHARRILDAVANPAGFYEFDPRIHVPEGSWIVWPWLYDYAMAQAVRFLTWISGAPEPMAILVYIPVLWAYVTVGLMLAIAAALGLPWPLRLLAGLFAAALPLNQSLHGVGHIDHHYMEYTFVLLTLLGGIKWFQRSDDPAFASFLGLTLALAVGLHNGLFVLQLPVLAALFVCWVKGLPLDPHGARWFAVSLLGGTLIVLLPSQPFLMGWFEFYYLSWFHLYVAVGTAVVTLFLSHRSRSLMNLLVLAAVGAAMLAPLVAQFIVAGDFLARRIARLEGIEEAKSILTMLRAPNGLRYINSLYSLMLWSLPLVGLASFVRLIRAREAKEVFFHVTVIAGLLLLAQQFRLHYFGSFALILPLLLGANWLADRWPERRIVIYGLTASIALGSFSSGSVDRMLAGPQIALDERYEIFHFLINKLEPLCEERPGTVLSYNDAGHYIRYMTECSVIANNFLLTQLHQRKIAEIDRLLAMSIDDLLRERPDIEYLLLDFPKLYLINTDGSKSLLSDEQLQQVNAQWPLINEVLFAPQVEGLDPRLRVIAQSVVREEGREVVAARAIEIRQTAATP